MFHFILALFFSPNLLKLSCFSSSKQLRSFTKSLHSVLFQSKSKEIFYPVALLGVEGGPPGMSPFWGDTILCYQSNKKKIMKCLISLKMLIYTCATVGHNFDNDGNLKSLFKTAGQKSDVYGVCENWTVLLCYFSSLLLQL